MLILNSEVTAFIVGIGYLVKILSNRSAILNPQNLENISNFESWTWPWLLRNKNKCIAKTWEKHLEKKVTKSPGSLLKISLWGSSVSTSASQPHGFSLRGTSIPNELFQTINELERLVSYSKQLHKQSWAYC